MSRKRVLTLDKDNESINSTKYRAKIGSLLYFFASRPDIMFSVCLYARFQEDPKVSHLEAVKRIFRYIKGTQHLGLWYPKDTGVNVLVYANSDHAGDVVDRKSTSGIFTFVGSCLTSWFSKKQTPRANSIIESDYVAAEGLIRHHFLKDNVAKKYITIDKIPLVENAANILTKPLEKDQFSYLRLGMGLMLQEEEEEEKKGQDVIEEQMSNLEGSVNQGEIGESSEKLKRKFETMKGYEGDERIIFEFILNGFAKCEIWDKVKEPLSPKLNEDEYSICCENTTHMINALKEARMESREMLLSIHHRLKMLLDIISKMNRKLEDEKVKSNDKGKDK
ncbi:hypothetical protein Tco_1163755 [Tanacetum coccineum]